MGGQEEYRGLFFSEAREYLQILSNYALQLEKNGDKEILAEMFRAAHSLKGMSSTIGFHDISLLTHVMEDLLEKLRSEELTMTTEIADLFFECVEHLEALLTLTELGEEGYVDEELLQRLSMASNTPEEKDIKVHTGLKVTLKPNTPMKSVRAYMILSVLEGMGDIKECVPPIHDIEEERFDTSFIVYIQTEFDIDEIISRLIAIGDVENVEPIIHEEIPVLTTNGDKDKKESLNSRNGTVKRGRHVEKFVRVEAHRLDKMMNLVGELVINRTTLIQVGKPLASRELEGALEELGRIIQTLQNSVMEMRMVPIKQVFDQFPRMVRKLSNEKGKKIELVIEGETTELDRSIVNQISDPMVHLIRNSVDHGIESPQERRNAKKDETGLITLSACHEGGYIFIRISDNGRGMNPIHLKEVAIKKGVITKEEASRLTDEESLELVFRAGLSTAEEVTDISGRGVGMDVVRSVLEALNGSISVKTKEGQGTTFEMRLPLTLAIVEGLLVKVDDNIYVVPIESIRENIVMSTQTIKRIQGNPVILVRNELIPILSLPRFFGEEDKNFTAFSETDSEHVPLKEISLMILESGSKKVAIPVDEFIGQQEIVIKSLGGLLRDIPGIAGATILGDGHVAPILDANTLVHWGDLHVQEGVDSR